MKKQIITLLLRRYFSHDVACQAAALVYYLLFSLFPLLILVSSLISTLIHDVPAIPDTLSAVLPESVLVIAETYLNYVSENVSRSMLWFSAVFSVWFPLRATRCLLRSVRIAYGLGKPKHKFRYHFRTVFFTVLLLTCLVTSLLLLSLGSRAAQAMMSVWSLPRYFPGLWGVLRFIFLSAVIFAAVFALYAAAQDERRPIYALLPGAALATPAWIAVSLGYSFYAEHISNYSAVYGALGAVIVLLIWLYLTAITLIMGAEFNHILLQMHHTAPQQALDQGENL